MNWYAIFVETGHEDDICAYIDSVMAQPGVTLPYSLFVPKRILYERRRGALKKVVRNLFPGYILVGTEDICGFYLSVRNVPHIIRFLGSRDAFWPVQCDEITRILSMANRDGLIGISKGRLANGRIIITDGPLLGSESMIRKIDKRKGRAKVEFLLSDNHCRVDLGIRIENEPCRF